MEIERRNLKSQSYLDPSQSFSKIRIQTFLMHKLFLTLVLMGCFFTLIFDGGGGGLNQFIPFLFVKTIEKVIRFEDIGFFGGSSVSWIRNSDFYTLIKSIILGIIFHIWCLMKAKIGDKD